MKRAAILENLREIRARSIFSNLGEKDLDALAPYCRVEDLKAGDVFVRQSETGKELAILLKGEASLFNKLHTGREFHLEDLKVGRSVDFAALLQGTPWHQSARMKKSGSVLWVDGKRLLSALQGNEENYRYLRLMTLEPSLQTFSRTFKYSDDIDFRDFKAFILAFTPVEFASGTVIQDQDKEVRDVYLLRSGKVKVSQYNSSLEQDVSLGEIETTTLFAHHQISVRQRVSVLKYLALGDVSAWRIPLEIYLAFIKKYAFLKPLFDQSAAQILKESRFTATKSRKDIERIPEEGEGDEEEDEFDYDRDEKYRRRFPVVRQHDEMDCAAACMATLCQYHGIDIGVPYFRAAIDVGPEGASLYGVAAAAERVGFLTRGVKIGPEDLPEIKLPAVTNQGYHFVVIYDVRPKYVLLGDPALGLRKVPHETFRENWSGIVLLFNATPDFQKNKPQESTYSLYWQLFRPYRKYFFQILLVSLLLNLLGLMGPVFSQFVIDRVLPTGDRQLLTVLTVGIVIVFTMTIVSGALRRYFTTFMGMKLDIEMSAQFMRHLLRLPAKFFASRTTGDTMLRLGDIDNIKSFVTSVGIGAILDLSMLVVYMAVIFLYSPPIAAVAAVAIVVLFAATRIVGKRIIGHHAELVKVSGESSTLLIETIKNINTFKTFGAETPRRWKWEGKLAREGQIGLRMSGAQNMFQIVIESLYRGIPFLILIYGASQVLRGESSIGTVVALSSMVGMALSPVMNLSGVFIEFQEVLFAFTRLNDIFTTEPEDKIENYVPISVSETKGHLKFEGVSFRYGNEESPVILNGINLEIFPGQRVAVIGRSGSGKTTLVQLLNRLYDPYEGRVLLDGYDLKLFPLSELRRIVGVVTQDTKLISGTILENIALGDEFPNMERVIRASELAAAEEFIRNQPMGYFQPLLEDGGGLSGGQKQRIAIARALYRNPRILVMDEATSNLDNESEAAISHAMPEICRGRTVIMIAHRLNTVKGCDQIFVVDQGQVIEAGKHEELLKKQGAYTQLVSQSAL